jgi:hypothetical protein
MDSSPEARILAHMNKSHKLSLYDYLEFYHGIHLNQRRSEIFLTDVALDSMTVTYTLGHSKLIAKIPIDPPMASFDDARVTLVNMAKEAASGLGFSAYQVTTYVPPGIGDPIAVVLLPLLFIVNVAFQDFFYPLIDKIYPVAGHIFRKYGVSVTVATAGIHILEVLLLLLPVLNKYRVPYPARAMWIVSNFVEGYPAVNRLKVEGERLEH